MDKTKQRALYPWETIQGCERPIGCDQPLEDSAVLPAESPPPLDPPVPPAYVLAHAFQDTQVTLLWGEAKGADGYLILRSEGRGSPRPVAAVEEPSYIDSQTRPGKTYCYAVRAYNEQGQSAATPAAAVTLPPAPEPEPEPEPAQWPEPELSPVDGSYAAAPEPPAGLCASVRGTHLVELQWQDSGEDAQYRLYRSATPWCSYGLVAETKDCRFLDTVPEAGTKYYYFAQAVRDVRSSKASAMAEALAFPELPPPEPPERLRAAVQPDAVELRWPHARGAAAYAVYARVEGGDFRVVGHTLDGGYLHEGLPADVTVDYRVQAYHGTGVSEPSAICTVHTGAARPSSTRPSRSPAQNRRFPAFSLQALQNPLIK